MPDLTSARSGTEECGGLATLKVSGAYQSGHDIVLPIAGGDLCVEVKARADGFRELYSWLEGRDVLIVRADRQEPARRPSAVAGGEIAKPTAGR